MKLTKECWKRNKLNKWSTPGSSYDSDAHWARSAASGMPHASAHVFPVSSLLKQPFAVQQFDGV